MNRLVLHHTGSEEGWGGALEKQKILECLGIFFSANRMSEAERPFIGEEIRNIIAADTDMKDVVLASKSAKKP